MNELLKEALLESFATHYTYCLRAKNYHWNVEGQDFKEFHELFDELASKTWKNLDKFAERIRAYNGYVPASLEELRMLSKLPVEKTGKMTIQQRVKSLYKDGELVLETLKKAYGIAKALDEPTVMDFLSVSMDKQHKQSWMLLSSMEP